jgi:hypothetical protein
MGPFDTRREYSEVYFDTKIHFVAIYQNCLCGLDSWRRLGSLGGCEIRGK